MAAAAAGAMLTAVTGMQPGLLLGLLILAGTITGGLMVRHRAAYVVIPVPALAYLAAASAAGLYVDSDMDGSLAGLATSALQWAASGFWLMTITTGVAITLAAVRWVTAPSPLEMRSGG